MRESVCVSARETGDLGALGFERLELTFLFPFALSFLFEPTLSVDPPWA